MITKLINYLNFHLEGLGFSSVNDFNESAFHLSSFKPIFLTSFSLGTAAVCIETYLGITPLVYLSFMALIVGEFITGIKASKKKGRKIQSRKLGRMITKMAVYTAIIGILFSFASQLNPPNLWGFEVNIYQWIYYTVLNMIIIQLIISLLENLTEMGFAETNKIFRLLKSKLDKWFELKNEEK